MGSDTVKAGLLKHIAQVEEGYPLARFNPLAVGGTADYYTEATSTVELAAAVNAAILQEIPYVVIGRGSHILFSDGGFPGLVVQNTSSGMALAADRSQIVVDAGMELSRLVTAAAGYGLGGLVPFFGQSGTVGGALYRNLEVGGQAIRSSVRQVTVLVPPSRLTTQATIARHPADWLFTELENSRLKALKVRKGWLEPQPLILTASFQLTSNRHDELTTRIQRQARLLPVAPKHTLGPLFAPLPNADLDELLIKAGVSGLRVGSVYPDRYHPNYIARRGRCTSEEIFSLMEQIRQRMHEVFAVELISNLERVEI